MADEAKFGVYRAGTGTRAARRSRQCCNGSNSQMLRFVRAADLRAEWDNVRRKEKAVDRTADYRCLLLFLSRRRAGQSRAEREADSG